MAEIVSFTEFQDVYIMTHPTIKSRNQKAQTEWNQIKLKHLTKKQIKSKRLRKRAGTNTKKKKKEEKKHSDTESSSDDDIPFYEWRRQQREAAKNKKKNTNTNNNDK
eukprot:923521_1